MDTGRFELKSQLIQRIGTARSITESAMLFKAFQTELNDCRFVFAAEHGGQPGYAVNKTFSSGTAIRTLFPTDRVLVIDKDSIARDGEYSYAFDHSIALDASAVSVFKPFLEERRRVSADTVEVIEYLAADNVSFDPLPYILENLHNLEKGLAAGEEIFKRVIGYEAIRTLDLECLRNHGIIRSSLDADALAKRAAHVLAKMYDNALNERFIQELKRVHQTMYLLLLKMAIIQISRPKESLNKKLSAFLHFCDAKLATMHLRELPIAKAYFEHGQKLRFFGKVQKGYQGNESLFEHLENMAWDLYHVRHLELAMAFHREPEGDYFFSALLTFDKRLIEILDLCSLRSIAFVGDPPRPIAFPAQDPIRFLEPADIEAIFSVEATHSREVRRPAANAGRLLLARELEDQLAEVACVSARLRPF